MMITFTVVEPWKIFQLSGFLCFSLFCPLWFHRVDCLNRVIDFGTGNMLKMYIGTRFNDFAVLPAKK